MGCYTKRISCQTVKTLNYNEHHIETLYHTQENNLSCLFASQSTWKCSASEVMLPKQAQGT